jgi:hypothetical protein
MPTTLQAIATTTVGAGGASSIVFSAIPATYTDLLIKISARSNRASVTVDTIKLTFNGNTSSYSNKGLAGNGGGVFSFQNSGTASIEDNAATTGASATASTFGNGDIYIANYTAAINKSVYTDGVSETNSASGYQFLTAGLWANSAAITSITLVPLVGTSFDQYSTATLYGIKKD